MIQAFRHIFVSLLLAILALQGNAQIFPVQATTQLVPPYSVYLPDYATGINNQLRVLLLNKDVSQPGYKVKLKMTVELNGSLIMRTSENFTPQPITLEPNQPLSVESSMLAPYLNSDNLDFIGYSKQDYETKKGLPEGAYKICFTAYDYFRTDQVKVSNEACSFYYLTKNDPPFINQPSCGVFIAPQLENTESAINRAGRWLAYTLDIPWDVNEQNIWYSLVVGPLTQQFEGHFDNADARNTIYELGHQYALNKNKEWVPAYGNSWMELVFADFTADVVEVWSNEHIKLGSSNSSNGVATGLADAALGEGDVELAPFLPQVPGGNTNIIFTWTPRHTNSPNSTLSTLYKLELFEIRPHADNAQLAGLANNAVQTGTPIFTESTNNTSFNYGPDKPMLIDGMQYAWRVKAYDANGRDWFNNNGYSEVCYFTFGGTPPAGGGVQQLEDITVFNAVAEAERRAAMNWNQAGAYTGYRVRYRKKNGSGNWFEINTDSLHTKAYDLEPGTAYQAQVQGKLASFYGPFSVIKEFTTPTPAPPPGCGQPINAAAGLSQVPLAIAEPNMYIKTGTFEFQVDTVTNGNSPGYYSGKGHVTNIPFLSVTGLKVQFDNVFININHEVTTGTVYAVSRPLDEWLAGWDEYYEERRKEKKQAENRRLFADLDPNAIMLPSFDFAIGGVKYDQNSGVLTITDSEGNIHTVTLTAEQKLHDIIIKGKGDDQWVVRPDGTVHYVQGGGLYPGMNIVVSDDDINYMKQAITKLKVKYEGLNATIQSDFNQKKAARKTYINNIKSTYMSYSGAGSGSGSETGMLGMAKVKLKQADNYTAVEDGFKIAEHKLNVRKAVLVFAKETNTKSDYEAVCKILKVGTVNFVEFVKTSKQQSKPDSYITDEAMNALDLMLDIILKSKNY
jgi:Fibronectin type III domain